MWHNNGHSRMCIYIYSWMYVYGSLCICGWVAKERTLFSASLTSISESLCICGWVAKERTLFSASLTSISESLCICRWVAKERTLFSASLTSISESPLSILAQRPHKELYLHEPVKPGKRTKDVG